MPEDKVVVDATQTTQESAAEPHGTPQGEPNGGTNAEPEVDWKAKARLWEKRAKENSEAKAELDALREQNMSEQEKAVKRAEQAERELAEARREIAVHKAAMEAGVDESVLARMNGSTPEEIAENAQALKEAFANSSRYPELLDKGTQSMAKVDEKSIDAISNPVERIKARAEAINQGLL